MESYTYIFSEPHVGHRTAKEEVQTQATKWQ